MDDNYLHITQKDFLEVTEEIIGKGGQFSFIARGTSMSPFIRDGATVIIRPATGSLRVGDVVLSKTTEGRLLLHRVIRKQHDGVITRGDASLLDDGIVPRKNILGKIIHVSSNGSNFHLTFPFNFLTAKGMRLRKYLNRFPSLVRFFKKIAQILG